MIIEDWIKRYFSEEQIPEVLDILSEYGTESWHREEDRVKRDIIIISAGSMEKLKATVMLAKNDYRDILIGEAIDPLVIGELSKYKT
jgi:ribulose 1,5-bisphosphate synthetase/thiazole synthase